MNVYDNSLETYRNETIRIYCKGFDEECSRLNYNLSYRLYIDGSLVENKSMYSGYGIDFTYKLTSSKNYTMYVKVLDNDNDFIKTDLITIVVSNDSYIENINNKIKIIMLYLSVFCIGFFAIHIRNKLGLLLIPGYQIYIIVTRIILKYAFIWFFVIIILHKIGIFPLKLVPYFEISLYPIILLISLVFIEANFPEKNLRLWLFTTIGMFLTTILLISCIPNTDFFVCV